MENSNKTSKKKQRYLLCGVGLGVLVLCSGGYYLLPHSEVKLEKPKQPPQLVGVINQTFNQKFTENALRENNAKTSTLEEKYQKLSTVVEKKKGMIKRLESKIVEQGKRIDNLIKSHAEQLENLHRDVNNAGKTVTIEASDMTNAGGVGGYRPTENNRYLRQISSMTVNKLLLAPIKNDLPYIPSGSFAEAIIIEGADANASVTGNNNTNPIQFRLTGKVQMPNDHDFDLQGCFVTGEVYGDISSERGEVRTRNISCKFDNQLIDMPFKGHVAFMGKNGIKGVPVMRNGKIIAWAGAAGALSGIGKSTEAASNTIAGMGATAKMSGGDLFKSSLGGALSKSSSTLSDYYIKRAEQYHPVIDIGAGNKVTIIFQEGLQLQYVGTKQENQDLLRNGRNKEALISITNEQNKIQTIKQNPSPVSETLQQDLPDVPDNVIMGEFIQ